MSTYKKNDICVVQIKNCTLNTKNDNGLFFSNEKNEKYLY